MPIFFARIAPVLLASIFCGVVFGQEYPNKTIRLVVPFPPGGIDIPGRLISNKLSESLGKTVVLDYRSGANGVIGCELVARAVPDGYTLLFTTSNTQIVAAFTSKNLPYDPAKDFTPISITNESGLFLAVHPTNPANSVRELFENARRNPGKLSFASTGVGSFFQLIGESLKQLSGADLLHVPYKGTGPMMQAVMGGEVTMIFGGSAVLPMAAAGKLKLLAYMDSKRLPSRPELAAMTETFSGFQRVAGWMGYFGPVGLSPAVVARLYGEIAKALASPDLREKLIENGQVIYAMTPAESAVQIKKDTEAIGRIVKAAGIEPE